MTKCSNCEHNQGLAGKEAAVPEKTYDQVSLEEALALDAPLIKVAGAAGAGKTEYLVQKVAALLSSGSTPDSLCVVVSSRDAQETFKMRLHQVGAQAEGVKVTTIVGLCREILESTSARQSTGRVPRILNGAEYKILLEDMKVFGIQPGRIRKMLNFFYFQWSQLEPEAEWLLPREETGVRRALDTYLRNRKAMIREELAPVCAGYLAQQDQPALFDYVLVDDYQNLSKASQVVCESLARVATIVTGNENQLIEGIDPYPFKEGFTCFEHHRAGAVCVQLQENLRPSAAIASIGDALCKQGALFPGYEAAQSTPVNIKDITQIKWSFPEEEFRGLPVVVKDILAKNPDLEPGDIYVVAPNKKWARVISGNLAKLGVDSTVGLDAQVLTGDPREMDRAQALIAYTKLNLLADPEDVVAWRSWCGFGNYLCYSGAWTRFETWALEQQKDILTAFELLAALEEEPFLEAGVIKERWKTGQEAITTLSKKSGFALINALVAESGASEFANLLETALGDETPEMLFRLVNEAILEPSFDESVKKVRIGSYKRLQGLTPKVVVVSALIDGFMPSRNSFDVALMEEDREKEKNICRRVFYNAITKPSEQLVVSTLQKADLEIAEFMKMEVRRVRMEQGKRLAMLSPSVFIDEAGDAIPGAVSGQQYLGEI